MYKFVQKILSLFFILLFSAAAWGSFPSGAAASGGSAVRVLLSVGANETLFAQVIGGYTCGDRSFFGGELTVKVTKTGVRVIHSSDGLICQGASVTVSPMPAYPESRIRLFNSRYGECSYPGALIFSKTPKGFVRAVNRVSMEDYQSGVLIGELRASLPIEALKAQAVAAKGFVLPYLNDKSEPFDIGDTNSHQVYKGCADQDAAVRAAVSAVAGETLYHDGAPVKCYYCTGNGGQTLTPEMVWGGSGNGVYRMAFDPYDLAATPEARTFLVSEDPKYLPDAIYDYFLSQLSKTDPTASRILRIESLEGRFESTSAPAATASPAGRAPQKRAVLRAEVIGPEGARTVTAAFDLAELSAPALLNAAQANVWFVLEQPDGFLVVFSKSQGHRVGMSHRGLVQMAEEGFSYREILSFYYPGATLERDF